MILVVFVFVKLPHFSRFVDFRLASIPLGLRESFETICGVECRLGGGNSQFSTDFPTYTYSDLFGIVLKYGGKKVKVGDVKKITLLEYLSD